MASARCPAGARAGTTPYIEPASLPSSTSCSIWYSGSAALHAPTTCYEELQPSPQNPKPYPYTTICACGAVNIARSCHAGHRERAGALGWRGRAPAVAILQPEGVHAALQAEEAQLAPEAAPGVADQPEGRAILLAPAHHLRPQHNLYSPVPNGPTTSITHISCSARPSTPPEAGKLTSVSNYILQFRRSAHAAVHGSRTHDAAD